MLSMEKFGGQLRNRGFSFFTGVPCSFLKSVINYAINECQYVAAANEGDALAIAAGAAIGGKRPVVLMQNSGLTNAASPLVSLNYPFRIPVLGFVSLRGEPGLSDEPQHELMGQITIGMLELMQVDWQYLSDVPEDAEEQFDRAGDCIDRGRPFFFVVRKNTFCQEPLKEQNRAFHGNQNKSTKQAPDELPSRYEALTVINRMKDVHTVQLATTGLTGRELYEIEDSRCNLYMVGSMGCVSSLGLGLALVQPSKDIVVIDGDGSLLMRMGSLATNGYYRPANMLHIVLDNNAHDSTGGQVTVSHNVHFVDMAASCGYLKSFYVHSLRELEEFIERWKRTRGLTFLHMKISRSSGKGTGRPQIKPYQVKERLQRFLSATFSGDKEEDA